MRGTLYWKTNNKLITSGDALERIWADFGKEEKYSDSEFDKDNVDKEEMSDLSSEEESKYILNLGQVFFTGHIPQVYTDVQVQVTVVLVCNQESWA